MTFLRRPRFARRTIAAGLLSALALGSVAHTAPAHVRAASPRASTTANTLTLGWAIETKTLDPANNPQNPDIWVIANIYDQLIRVANDGKTLTPDLATSWNITGNGTVYTFHLRSGVVFHNGQKLTAADVKFSLDRARNPSEAWSWTLGAVKSIAAPNASTVVVTLKHPWAPFLSDVSLFDTGVYPEAYFKKVGASYMSSHPIGTGPYSLDSWKRGQYLRLQKNAHYWMASKFPMQYVEYDLIPDNNTRLLKTEAGELDIDNVLPPNQIAAVKNNSAVKVVIDPSTETYYFVPNTKVAPFGDLKVRQAISHAIDRTSFVKAIQYGYASVANSFLPKGAIDYNSTIPVPTYDLALAKKLMSASSVPHGFKMTFYVSSGDTIGNEEAQVFQSDVAQIGIQVTIKTMDGTTLFNDQQAGKISFTTNIWTNDIPDPDELVTFSAACAAGSSNFNSFYCNQQVKALAQKAEQSSDSATRQSLYYQIQQLWAHDQWFYALYYAPFVNAVNSHVHGFHENPLGYFVFQGVSKS
jgi:peptide/nickel transport system substrate-binding protein